MTKAFSPFLGYLTHAGFRFLGGCRHPRAFSLAPFVRANLFEQKRHGSLVAIAACSVFVKPKAPRCWLQTMSQPYIDPRKVAEKAKESARKRENRKARRTARERQKRNNINGTIEQLCGILSMDPKCETRAVLQNAIQIIQDLQIEQHGLMRSVHILHSQVQAHTIQPGCDPAHLADHQQQRYCKQRPREVRAAPVSKADSDLFSGVSLLLSLGASDGSS